ncbi:MAG: 2-pyrone-4,6-dicarboxylate hydrolase [Polaromonas sp.]|jgi:2-pyrone-4,6-dicarboxylate lactonase|nr:2-pyrone-4,6-dicarboxylate hydrolase [Polaromonas sp.]
MNPILTTSKESDALEALMLRMPAGAWDTHFHTVNAPGTEHHMPVDEVLAMHRRIGIERGVMVQSLLHGATQEQFIHDLQSVPQWRGVAIIDAQTDDQALDRLQEAGVCAIRMTFVGFLNRKPSMESFAQAMSRASERGWHVLLHLEPDNLLELADTIASLPTPVVIDHCAHVDTEKGLDQPAVKCLLELHRLAHCWVKLSSLDRWAPSGAPHYFEAVTLASAVLRNAPQRVLWATDWPHVMYKNPRNPVDPPPATADLVQMLFTSVSDDGALLKRVLVDNPARLYG